MIEAWILKLDMKYVNRSFEKRTFYTSLSCNWNWHWTKKNMFLNIMVYRLQTNQNRRILWCMLPNAHASIQQLCFFLISVSVHPLTFSHQSCYFQVSKTHSPTPSYFSRNAHKSSILILQFGSQHNMILWDTKGTHTRDNV